MTSIELRTTCSHCGNTITPTDTCIACTNAEHSMAIIGANPFAVGTNVVIYPLTNGGTGYLVGKADTAMPTWWVPHIANSESPTLSELNAGLPISDALTKGMLDSSTYINNIDELLRFRMHYEMNGWELHEQRVDIVA